jgi:hypothetical protein
MEKARFYAIRVEGQLMDHWADWFDGLVIQTCPDGETKLSGALADQSALFGVLNKIHALNLTLISVCKINSDLQG